METGLQLTSTTARTGETAYSPGLANPPALRIAELFESRQGEGRWAGTPSLFIRTTGCNLRCWFCDTPYTSWRPEGVHLTLPDILDRVLSSDCEHVVITGGEPLLPGGITDLTRSLRRFGRYITIETGGTVWRDVDCDLMSISPKLANSTPQDPRWRSRHEAARSNPQVIRRLISNFDFQFKFVIDSLQDVRDVEQWLRPFPEIPADTVYLMPQGVDRHALREKSQWLEEEARRRGWKLAPRLHIEWYGHTRGT